MIPIMNEDKSADTTRSSQRQRKKAARQLLRKHNPEAVVAWAREEVGPMRTLSTVLFDPDPLIRWRTIEALGRVAEDISHDDLEQVRGQIRKFLWAMNDESGGLCWNGPEAIGEILHNVPSLLNEYGAILPSFFIEEPFERGSLWAVGRVAAQRPDIFAGAIDDIVASLKDSDAVIRGYAILALGALERKEALEQARPLFDDLATLTVYDFESGELRVSSVGDLARTALDD